ncbi:MAG: hypothetical protein HY290_32910 [Planctomycetia bacterium]|nr:hypothetical protein [Planctomycetia bacterium]
MPKILAWADAFHRRHGFWPTSRSGKIPARGSETWYGIHNALRRGVRGMPGGSSLSRLLRRHRSVVRGRDRLDEDLIFRWAQDHLRRTGKWPQAADGPVCPSCAATWRDINRALRYGYRGLPGGASLTKLLIDRKVVSPELRSRRLALTLDQIWDWAQAFHRRHRKWPIIDSGPIPASDGDTWAKVEKALRGGRRGLPGGSSLFKFLMSRGAVGRMPPRLTVPLILEWADAFHLRNKFWPQAGSGPIASRTPETWKRVDAALYNGLRGLPGGSSLAQELRRHRGVQRSGKPTGRPLSVERILIWADAFHRRHGTWPVSRSGLVAGQDDETWERIDYSLRCGCRGLSGGSSLSRELAKHRGTLNSKDRLTEDRVFRWAQNYFRRTGRWPNSGSGRSPEAGGATWNSINNALIVGHRGLPGGSSLCRLFGRKADRRNAAGSSHR